MTLFTFPSPLADARRVIATNVARWPAGTTHSSKPALTVGAAPHIQLRWDGTPSDEQQRERCVLGVTVWGWKVETSPGTWVTSEDDLYDLASLVRAVFLDAGSSDVWRYTRGIGRLPGVDPATKVPFCTFTLTAETRPTAVA